MQAIGPMHRVSNIMEKMCLATWPLVIGFSSARGFSIWRGAKAGLPALANTVVKFHSKQKRCSTFILTNLGPPIANINSEFAPKKLLFL